MMDKDLLLEDLLDDIEAVDKTASSKMVRAIDIDNETRISPVKAEKHDLLFRIKYDPYQFPNSMNEFFSATNHNRTIDMSKDELEELNAFIRDIKERIYILGENARFIDEMSEVLFVCGNKLAVDYLSEFSDENQTNLGWEFKDSLDAIYIIFSIKLKFNYTMLRQSVRFIGNLFNILENKTFKDKLETKIVRHMTTNSWYFGNDENYLDWSKDTIQFAVNRGALKDNGLNSLGNAYKVWYDYGRLLYYADDETLLAQMQDLTYHFDVSKYMFRFYYYNVANGRGEFKYSSAQRLEIRKHLPKNNSLDLSKMLKFSLSKKRKIQYKVVQYLFFPLFGDGNTAVYSADDSERDYKIHSDARQYIENLNEYITEGNPVEIIDAMFTMGGSTTRSMAQRLIMHVGLPDYNDGSAQREVCIIFKVNLMEDVPDANWDKSKSKFNYWEQWFVKKLNEYVFYENPISDDFFDKLREQK